MNNEELLNQIIKQEAFLNQMLEDTASLKRGIVEGKYPFLSYPEDLNLLEDKLNHIQLLLKDIHIQIWRVSYE